MNRAFLSLYALVVVSLVLVGWGADKLWQAYNPEPEVEPYEVLFFKLVEDELKDLTIEQAHTRAQELAVILDQNVTVFSIEDFARSTLSEKIALGQIVTLYDEAGQKSSYQRIKTHDFIVRIRLDKVGPEQGGFYFGLLIAFYVVIAIIIYFWIWPLSRDLRKLQFYTQKVGVAGASGKVELGQRSTVYALASAFNRMSERIHDLLATNKEMTYAVSHELRTPLARMKFALEMAKDSDSVSVKEKQIDSVREDVAEMDKLINELLVYASFEQHRQQLEFKKGVLSSLIENLCLAHDELNSHEVKIKWKIDNQLDTREVHCEWYLLERSVHNVIQNAFKYCQQEIHITLLQTNGNNQIVVEDDGPGIGDEDADKIFNAFVRLRNEETENKSGFGLGLAIAHRIMKWHQGGIKVGQSPLGGARFTLFWPMQ